MVIHDEPAPVYFARPEISNSMLSKMASTPFDFWAHYVDPNRPDKETTTDAMEFGNLFHCRLFEPQLFEKRYYIAPNIRRGTKEWKAHEEAADGRTMFKQQDVEDIERMVDSIMSVSHIRDLIESAGYNECTVLWTDDETGIDCRGRIDKLSIENEFFLDVKTTTDVSPGKFNRKIWDMGYDRQCAMYTDGVAAEIPQAADWSFYWVVIESKFPFKAELFAASEQWVEVGRARYKYLLRKLKQCRESGKWPSYTDAPQILSPAAWQLDAMIGVPHE